MRVVSRLILVPFGMLLAAGASLAVLLTLGLERLTHAFHGQDIGLGHVEQGVAFVLGAYGVASVAVLVPALLVVIVGEVARIRSATYYIVTGGAALCAVPLLARLGTFDGGMASMGAIWQVFATAGFVGGLVYWLVVGRSA